MKKLIFLSHIHEEKELAIEIKNAIEDEFSGFVEAFVSSDGTSISAGANFLDKIEEGLRSCIGGIFLISHNSVKRNWINFELGALWIRNTMSEKIKIPIIPFCHGGITPSTLPSPLNNLNSIDATNSSSLKFAFESIQIAAEGKGNLKTNFDELAEKINYWSTNYTIVKKLLEALKELGFTQKNIELAFLAMNKNLNEGKNYDTISIIKEPHSFNELNKLVSDSLQGFLTLKNKGFQIRASNNGSLQGYTIEVSFNLRKILKYEKEILGAYNL